MDTLPENIFFKDAASRFLRINRALATRWMRLARRRRGHRPPALSFDYFADEHASPAYADDNGKSVLLANLWWIS